MAHLELSDEERGALTVHLRQHIRESRYPFSLALRPLKAILAKLDPQPQPAAPPERKPYVPSTVMQEVRKRR